MTTQVSGKIDVTDLYDGLNHQYFGDRLQKCLVAFSDQTRPWDVQGNRILLDRGLEGEGLRRQLLYAMCCVESQGNRRRFRESLTRLGRQGEEWAADEADAIYLPVEQENTEGMCPACFEVRQTGLIIG